MNILLRDFPDVLLKYQNRFKYVMVDEYQDTNYSQYLIVKKLAARNQNICVVGDDAQSIYAFRGANIQNIFNFKRDYPNMNLFKLEQNYRSTQNIVNAANSVISQNKEQIKKDIWTDNGQGSLIKVLRAVDERDEARQIADTIVNARLDEDLDYKDFAILYRTNVQSRSLEEALRKMNIPYRIYAGISFYGRKEIKDVLSYLRVAINNHDDASLVRIINYPSRGIGQTTLDKIRIAAADNDVSIWTVLENISDFGLGLGANTLSRLMEFVTKIRFFTSQVYTTDAYTLAKQIVYQSGIITLLRNDDDPENANRIENIEELLNGIQEFCEKDDEITPGEDNSTPTGEVKTLDMFLQQVLLMTSEDKDNDDADKVSLMTIHAAKGLEFPYVYVAGMEENLFPSFMSISSRQELEEERRLFYVAVTRAEKQLYLTYALTRYQFGQSSSQEVSRFVEEIDPKYLQMPSGGRAYPKVGQMPSAFRNMGKPLQQTEQKKFVRVAKPQNTQTGPTQGNSPAEIAAIQVGLKVMHAKFGVGKVLQIEGSGNDAKALIFFENVGQKQLMLKFAKLTVIE
ncbi:MAG: UvrD-helicase domain-containing protein, partial [Bacteroidales bacterium]|nr:UvrD-helicase domain-containing protein [Bacteroidales bacterium]